MNKRVELLITNYIQEYLFEPERTWPEYYFKERCYSRWAAMEILEYIQNHPQMSAIESVKEFIHKTDQFMSVDHLDRNDTFIFSVAHNVAVNILDALNAML